jgi:hypothetical protein
LAYDSAGGGLNHAYPFLTQTRADPLQVGVCFPGIIKALQPRGVGRIVRITHFITMNRKKKPKSEKAERLNISMSPAMQKKANLLMKLRGTTNFSGMLVDLMGEEYDRRESLSKKFATFRHAFEHVFWEDWAHSDLMLYQNYNKGRKFLELRQYEGWEAHDALIKAYRALVAEEVKERIPVWEND